MFSAKFDSACGKLFAKFHPCDLFASYCVLTVFPLSAVYPETVTPDIPPPMVFATGEKIVIHVKMFNSSFPCFDE